MIEEVDLSDPSQAEAARDAVGEMLKPADDSLSPIPTRPPTKKEKKRREKQQQSSASGSNEPNATDIFKPEGKNALFKIYTHTFRYFVEGVMVISSGQRLRLS